MNYYPYETEHLKILRKVAPECCVLLKKDGAFPLDSPCKIALYGSGARKTIKGGTGSSDVNSHHFTTCEEGLENAGFEITTKKWLNAYDEIKCKAHTAFVEDIKNRAKAQGIPAVLLAMGAVCPEPEYSLPLDGESDTALYVVSRISGEGNDRNVEKGDFLLSDTETRDILAVAKRYKRFLLVLNVGGVIDLSPVLSVGNILNLSQLGAVTGDVLADIILGKSYPSGKLTSTWAKAEDYPAKDFGNADDTRYTEGIYVGYRYFDGFGVAPLFPFGFGLSYTDFAISCGNVTAKKDEITVAATVKNTGNYNGKQVVQLYLSAPCGKLDKPYKELVAFTKTDELVSGQNQTVTLKFNLSDFASYDEATTSYILEKGSYILRLGTSCADTAAVAMLNLSKTVTVKKAKNLCTGADFKDVAPCAYKKEIFNNLPVIKLTPEDFDTFTAEYSANTAIPKFIKGLTDEQLALTCLGQFTPSSGTFVIGNAGVTIAGSAGETTHAIKGLDYIIMADGPAGLRLNKHYGKDENGVYCLASEVPEYLKEFMTDKLAAILGISNNENRNGKILDQYCTAIPIGTAITQSWNTEVARLCGDIVGKEAKRFGVHLWLAPALNIHRSPLCGRNFEYCSEDPLISGKISAAITNGVQAQGCGVTIKHFACNNQETNRYSSNSILSERALREIYLKGFDIAIRESSPVAVMTSYNLINGVHTSEDSALICGILRSEFGFDGTVISDWISVQNKNTKYPIATAAASLKAGNDLFMPGCEGDYNDIISALLNGKLTRHELEKCAANVYRLINKLVNGKSK